MGVVGKKEARWRTRVERRAGFLWRVECSVVVIWMQFRKVWRGVGPDAKRFERNKKGTSVKSKVSSVRSVFFVD